MPGSDASGAALCATRMRAAGRPLRFAHAPCPSRYLKYAALFLIPQNVSQKRNAS